MLKHKLWVAKETVRYWIEDKGDSPLCGLAAGRYWWPRISGLATVVTAGPCAGDKFLWHWNSVVTESAILPHSLILVGSASYGWFSSPHKTHRSWLTLISSAQKQATELQSWLRGQSTDEVKSLDLQTPHQTWVGMAGGRGGLIGSQCMEARDRESLGQAGQPDSPKWGVEV